MSFWAFSKEKNELRLRLRRAKGKKRDRDWFYEWKIFGWKIL